MSLNQITLTGTIAGEVLGRSEADGTEAASCFMHFHMGNGNVRLFGFRETAQKLAQFRPGDSVVVVGRLTINAKNLLCAVLIDSIQQHVDRRYPRRVQVAGTRHGTPKDA